MIKPFLISFPRSGAHWLKTLIALHDESLLNTLVHSHDDDLSVSFLSKVNHHKLSPYERLAISAARSGNGMVVYLYRDPVAVMFSMSEYYRPVEHRPVEFVGKTPRHWPGEPAETKKRLNFWMEKWNRHVSKWTHGPDARGVDLYIRYPEVPQGARELLLGCGASAPGSLAATPEDVREFLRTKQPPYGWLARVRVLERHDQRRSARKEEFYTRWASLVRELCEHDTAKLPTGVV